MANNSVQGGLTPVRTLIGVLTGIGNEYEILASDGTATFVGDMMKAQNTASAVDGCPNAIVTGVPGAVLVLGSMRAIRPTLTNLTLQYRVASTLTRVNVEDNPWVTFHIKDGGASASADAFLYATITATAGNTTTGQSGYVINASSITGTGTTSLPLKILRTQPAIGNPVLNATSGSVYEVMIVNHTFNQQVASALI